MEKKKFEKIESKELEKTTGAMSPTAQKVVVKSASVWIIGILLAILGHSIKAGALEKIMKYIDQVKKNHPNWSDDQVVEFLNTDAKFNSLL